MYYDDYDHRLLARYHDFDRQEWLEQQNQYNSYGQLELTEDAKGNQTSYLTDEWGRRQRVTDAQGNQVVYEYDTYNRTKTTKFVPASTGIAENHSMETFDQWGRLVSSQGYPDGFGQPAVEETYEYDLVGNLTSQTDARNNATQFQYDPAFLLRGLIGLAFQAERVLEQLGIPMSNAIGLFLRQVVLQRGIPFDIKLQQSKPLSVGTLSEEQFNAEIEKGLADLTSGKVVSADSVADRI